MAKFNYQEYLADNYLLKESLGEARKPSGPATKSDLKGFATKDATLNREKRAEKGNWKGSLGKFVEEHGSEIQQAVDSRSLTNYVENTMMPALGPEAQEYLDDLISRSRSDAQLLFGLYNVALKGQGLGLHEEMNEAEDTVDSEYKNQVLNLVDTELMPAGSEEELWDEVERKMQWTGDWREDVKRVVSLYFDEPWDADEESAEMVRNLLSMDINLEDYS